MPSTHRREFLMQATGASLATQVGIEAEAAAAPPDLINLFAPIQAYSQTLTQRYSFLGSQWGNLASWKQVVRGECWNRLCFHPERAPLRAETLSRVEHAGYVREKVVFHSTAYTRVPAYLLLPKKARRQAPAIVALHDHGAFYYWGKEKIVQLENEPAELVATRQQAYDGVAYASQLAQAGYVVLVTDAFYFGERRLQLEKMATAEIEPLRTLRRESPDYVKTFNQLAGRHEQQVARTVLLSGATWPGMMIWDDLRSVDYLLSRPEVDPGRIGCMGLSIGGYRAAHLAALDPRIRSTVVTGWMCSYGSLLAHHLSHHTWMIYVPGLYEYVDLPDIASLTAPGALLVQYCERDKLFPLSGMRASDEKLHRIYAKAGSPDKFEARYYDVPHQFNRGMQADAFRWFERWL